jgi:hypothetical protein
VGYSGITRARIRTSALEIIVTAKMVSRALLDSGLHVTGFTLFMPSGWQPPALPVLLYAPVKARRGFAS